MVCYWDNEEYHDILLMEQLPQTQIMSLVSFHTPLKTENQRFFDVLRGYERDQWHEMGYKKILSLWLFIPVLRFLFHIFG